MTTTDGRAERLIGFCCLAAIAGLLVIGVVSHEIVRHLLQSSPFWIGAVLGLGRSGLARWAALPPMLFWLLISVLIWLYLLGVSTIVKGHYSPAEIAMTIVLAASAVTAAGAAVRSRARTRWWAALLTAALAGTLQFAAFDLSVQPTFAHDSAVIAALGGR